MPTTPAQDRRLAHLSPAVTPMRCANRRDPVTCRPNRSGLRAKRWLLLAAAGLVATAAAADDGALQRCRAVAEAQARLACYDALPLAPAPAAAAMPAAAAPPAAPDAVAAFGLESRREAVHEISSRIPGHFEGWSPGTRIELANGQVWEVTDDVSAAYELDDPKVTVRRAAFGSFMLDIEGARRSPRVRRIK